MATRLYDLLVKIFLVGCIIFGLVVVGSALLSMGPLGIVIGVVLVWLYAKNKEEKQDDK